MNCLFVIRSASECVDLATGTKSTISSACDLQPGQLAILVLSLLTSALMLGKKLASVEMVRLKQHEISRMEAERDTMLQELQQELQAAVGSPEEAREVEKIFTARRSSRHSVLGLSSVLPSPFPAPTESADVSIGSQVAAFRRCLDSMLLPSQDL